MKKLLMILVVCLLSVSAASHPMLTTNEATIIMVGPFVDATDGITPEVAIDVTTLTVEGYLENDAGTAPLRSFSFVPTASAGSNDMALITSSVSGVYSLELTQAQLNIVGRLRITIVDTDSAFIAAAPWWKDYIITAANMVDKEIGTAYQQILLADTDHAINHLTIDDDTGNALIIISRGGDGNAIHLTGHGTGDGINSNGGVEGYGLSGTLDITTLASIAYGIWSAESRTLTSLNVMYGGGE